MLGSLKLPLVALTALGLMCISDVAWAIVPICDPHPSATTSCPSVTECPPQAVDIALSCADTCCVDDQCTVSGSNDGRTYNDIYKKKYWTDQSLIHYCAGDAEFLYTVDPSGGTTCSCNAP